VKEKKLWIPISIFQFAAEKKLIKELKLYCCFKLLYPGLVGKNQFNVLNLMKLIGIKDRRTIAKYIKNLNKLNWIGEDPKTGTLFIRSWKRLLVDNQLKGNRKAELEIGILANFEAFVFSCIVECRHAKFRAVKYIPKYKRKKYGEPRNEKLTSIMDEVYPGNHNRSPYFGLANSTLAKLYGCANSKISRLKKQAKNCGFLFVKSRYLPLGICAKSKNLKQMFEKGYPDIANRLKVVKSSGDTIKLKIQLHDELRSLLCFKTNRF
jgi:hypothetical protein